MSKTTTYSLSFINPRNGKVTYSSKKTRVEIPPHSGVHGVQCLVQAVDADEYKAIVKQIKQMAPWVTIVSTEGDFYTIIDKLGLDRSTVDEFLTEMSSAKKVDVSTIMEEAIKTSEAASKADEFAKMFAEWQAEKNEEPDEDKTDQTEKKDSTKTSSKDKKQGKK